MYGASESPGERDTLLAGTGTETGSIWPFRFVRRMAIAVPSDAVMVMATSFSDKVASNEKGIMDNNLVIDKMKSADGTEAAIAEANALIESIDKSIDNFTVEAINAGREYSNHRMNQCIAVSITGSSLFGELKEIIVFAFLAYVAAMLLIISKKFPKH